ISTRTLLDLLVGVLERQAQFFGKQTPDGALSSSHRANEDYIPHLDHRFTAMAWLFMMRGVMKTSNSALLSLTMSRRNTRPRNGRSPRNGTFSTPLVWVLENTPPITMV